MAGRAKGTIQQYLASIHRFQEMTGKTADRASQEEIRRWVEPLQGQPEKAAFISMPRKDAPLPVILAKGDEMRKALTNAGLLPPAES
jgi:hypothetical protein